MKKMIVAALLAGALAMTACGGKTAEPAAEAPAEETAAEETAEETTEEAPAEETEEAEAESVSIVENIETELENGVLTVRVPEGSSVFGFSWGLYTGDKGDASLTELITGSDQEAGYDYVGSFKALEDQGEGEDYIRIAYANANITLAYFDIHVTVKDNAIQEITAVDTLKTGFEEDYLSTAEGAWVEEGEGAGSMSITKGQNMAYEVIIAKDTGKDGEIVLTTMHAYPDAVLGCLVYADGAEQKAAISDSEEDALEIGGGSLTGKIFSDSTEDGAPRMTWIDSDGEFLPFVME